MRSRSWWRRSRSTSARLRRDWRRWCERRCGPIRSAGPSTSSGRSVRNYRHSAYGFRFATVAYRWHPLFGSTLQVSPFRRGKALTCIYTEERPDLCRELPNWMFDAGYCAGMTLGRPEIGIEGLNELTIVLTALGANRKQGAQSRPSRKKERDGAKKPISQSRAAHPAAGASNSSSASGQKHEGTGRDIGRPSAGSAGGRSGSGRR